MCNQEKNQSSHQIRLPDIFLDTGLFLEACKLPVEAAWRAAIISSPWSANNMYNPSPLRQREPPSKQNLPSTTPYLLKSAICHCPATRGGTPVVRQKLLSWTCNLAGPGGSLKNYIALSIRIIILDKVSYLVFNGELDTSTRKWGPSFKWELSLICHCISLSRLSNANTTTTSWHTMATVCDSLSKVNPVSRPRKCCNDSDAFVWPCL